MPNRAEIRFRAKTIVTSLPRDIYSDHPKYYTIIKFSLSVIHVLYKSFYTVQIDFLSIRDSKIEGVPIKILGRAWHLKNTGHGNFVIGRFHTRAKNGLYPSETSLCTVALSPTDTPSPIFSEERGRLYTGYLKRIIYLQTVPSKLTDKVRWIIHSKLKPFHFQIKTYYLSDSNYQTDNPSHTNNP